MFNKNFDNYLLTTSCGVVAPTSTATETDYQSLDNTVSKTVSGTYFKGLVPYDNNSYRKYGIYVGLHLGDGSTTPTYFDYKLAGTQSGTVYLYSSQPSGYGLFHVIENGVHYVNVKAVWTNTSTSNKTIREIGIVANMGDASSSGNYPSSAWVMFYRTVLDADVTVVPQGNYIIDMKIAITDFRPNKPSA